MCNYTGTKNVHSTTTHSSATFPPGTPVWYNFKEKFDPNQTALGAYEGTVRAVSKNAHTGKWMYEVLDKEQKRVTWKQDIGRINANDSKAHVRHLEAVKARIVARRARTTNKLGRE
jgi:hypothetical protein